MLQSYSCSPSLISVLQLYHEICNKGFHILFRWAPAHVGSKSNKDADKATKQACNPLKSPVPYSSIKLAVQSFIRQRERNAQNENKRNQTMYCNLAYIHS